MIRRCTLTLKNYLGEISRRKDLLLYLVKSGLKAEHRNSYLGYFWWLLDPLLSIMVYYFLVVIILDRGGPDYPLFLTIGLIVWRWMSSTINTSAKSILRYSSIINQVALPKFIFPLSFTITQLVNFLFGLVVIGFALVVFGEMPTWHVALLPVIILIAYTFLLAVGSVLGYITVFIRDIDNLLTHVIRIFFYASPIIWIGGRLPEKYSWAVAINPIAHLVDAFRDVLMYHKVPDFTGLGVIFGVSVIVIIFMLNHFRKNEHKIIKAL